MSKELNIAEKLKAEAVAAQERAEKAWNDYNRLTTEHAQLRESLARHQLERNNVKAQIERLPGYIAERRAWLANSAGVEIYSTFVGGVCDAIASAEAMHRELTVALAAHEARLQDSHDKLASFVARHPKLELPTIPTPDERHQSFVKATSR